MALGLRLFTHDGSDMINEFDLPSDNSNSERLEIVRLLARVGIFSVLSNDQIGELAKQAQVVNYRAGEFIVRQGQKGHSLYVISSGQCEVFVTDLQAFGKTVATMSEGDFFGEMSLLTGDPVVATVRALKDSELLAIDKEIFADMLKKYPELSSQLADVLVERQKNYASITGKPLKNLPTSKSFIGRIKSFFHLD